MRDDDIVPSEVATAVARAFSSFHDGLAQLTHSASDALPGDVEGALSLVKRELLPYLLLTRWGRRAYRKPRGYAGDFLTIKWIYEGVEGGVGQLGNTFDRCLLDMPACVAVRNRRALLSREVEREIEAHGGRADVMSLACGPAEEIFDIFAGSADRRGLRVTLVDADYQALAHVADRRDRAGLRKNIQLDGTNLAHAALGRATLHVPPQDLVYSIGLIDYFEDRLVIELLNSIHRTLKPGGRVIVGNFHPRNPTRPVMEGLLDWRLIHRTEEDMVRLFTSSAFRATPRFFLEEQRINLFAECVRA